MLDLPDGWPRCRCRIVLRIFLLIAFAVLSSATQSWAHPFHTSSAELEYSISSNRFEVSVRLLASDLEEALTRLSAKPGQAGNSTERVDLEKTPDIDSMIVRYLESSFYVVAKSEAKTPSPPTRSKIQLAGKELDKTWIWIYFELTPPRAKAAEDVSVWEFTNRLFLELNEDQINTCQLLQRGSRQTLRTDAKQPSITLPKD